MHHTTYAFFVSTADVKNVTNLLLNKIHFFGGSNVSMFQFPDLDQPTLTEPRQIWAHHGAGEW